jgi:dTDP-4-amino-4,6-dideoxygalactose transaminase
MAFIAPAGTRLTLTEVGRGLLRGWSDEESAQRLEYDLCRLTGSFRAWSVVSGRAAMTVALRAMARCAGPQRRHVIVPAYTCYSVPAAVERAGLVPVPCDVDPESLSIDLDHLRQLASGEVLAILTANLFGIPNDLVEIEKIAHQFGAYMLDDAAQSLGAYVAGRPVGGFGDVGIFSFDKGKNISTMQGGALMARKSSLIKALERECDQLPDSGIAASTITTATLLPYTLLLRPSRYGMVHRMPMLRLGETRYELKYPVTRMNRGLIGLARAQLERIKRQQSIRVTNADALHAALDGMPGIRFIRMCPGAEPVYPRFPVRIATRAKRDLLQHELDNHGIGASSFYPSALADVPQVARLMPPSSHGFPGARAVAETILTLPTHAYCPADLPVRIRDIVRRIRL